MTEKRKQEVIKKLLDIHNNFEPNIEAGQFEPDMFWLMSSYINQYKNPELIGGAWVRENIPELKDLP